MSEQHFAYSPNRDAEVRLGDMITGDSGGEGVSALVELLLDAMVFQDQGPRAFQVR